MTAWTDDEIGGTVWSDQDGTGVEVSAFAKTLLNDADAATARATLDAASATALAASTGSSLVGHQASGTGALSTDLQTKVRRIKELGDRQAVDDTGSTSVLTPMTNAIADVGSGGRLIVRKGTYLISVTSASNCLLFPSGFHLDCEEGTILRWGGMGAFPLFAAIDKEDILITGAIFEWNGTLTDVSGSSTDFNGWTGTLANRDLSAHVLSLGSSGVRIKHCRTRTTGDNPSAATEAFYIAFGFHPKEDGTTRSTDNAVEDCKIDDVVQGVLLSAQDNFRFKSIRSRRFPGNHPVGGGSGLNGHLIYATENGGTTRSRGLEVRDVVDLGGSFGTITSRNDTSVQVKCAESATVSGVMSKRPTGIFSFAELVNGIVSDSTWAPATVESNGMNSAVINSVGVQESMLQNLSFILPDSTDKAAWNMTSMSGGRISAYISASHTTDSIASSVMTTCTDVDVEIKYRARSSTTCQAINFITSSLRNNVEITPIGQNHKLRPFANNGCTDNTVRMRDNMIAKWSERSYWNTEADAVTIGIESLKKTKVFRIGTGADPTTTFQLPRAGVWVGTCQLMDSTGANLLGGFYRIAWDAGSLQSVELIGNKWTVGGSAPTVLSLSVASTGVVTVTSTATSATYDLQYDFQCLGNNRYADF